jgi:hypothetical protein
VDGCYHPKFPRFLSPGNLLFPSGNIFSIDLNLFFGGHQRLHNVLARLQACDGLESYSQNTQTYLALIVDFRGIIFG